MENSEDAGAAAEAAANDGVLNNDCPLPEEAPGCGNIDGAGVDEPGNGEAAGAGGCGGIAGRWSVG